MTVRLAAMQSVRQRPELLPVPAVAGEEDDTRWRHAPDQRGLGRAELRALDADDGGANARASGHSVEPTTKHWPPCCWMAEQASVAASREANGPAWRRYMVPLTVAIRSTLGERSLSTVG